VDLRRFQVRGDLGLYLHQLALAAQDVDELAQICERGAVGGDGRLLGLAGRRIVR